MLNQRWRPLLFSGIALIVIWLLAWVGFTMARHARATPEKARAFVESTDLSRLSAGERTKALDRLAKMLNALTLEERRRARMDRAMREWMLVMTEEEKAKFLEATMPTGFKQMLTAFEQLPDDKRRRAVDEAIRKLREDQANGNTPSVMGQTGTNAPPPLSPELEAKVRSIGLATFYTQSSAQTRAELAPVMEELQRAMENGRALRGR
jgi:hypothetical protein